MGKIEQIIKYEGDNSTFIWKHPCEDFNSLTQLIVHESQEAIFLLNGQAKDVFGPGRYTLETENIPMIGKALNRATGGESPFHCEVYFINKTIQMGLKWGTDSRVRYIDPETGVPLELGASGELNMQIVDSRKLLVNLVGTMNGISWEYEGSGFTKSIQKAFRPLIMTEIKSNFTPAIKALDFDILEIDEHLVEIGSELHKRIIPGFEEYGITIPQFFLTTVVLPEEDPNFRKIRELHTISLRKKEITAEKEIKTTQAQADAEVTAAHGKVIAEEQNIETMKTREAGKRTEITAKAEAEKIRQAGLAEAEVMRAQGVDKKDYIAADVQKSYAEALGNMGANIGAGGSGGSGGSSPMSDILGLGIGLQAANAMSGQIGNIFAGMNAGGQPEAQQPAPQNPQAEGMDAFKMKVDKLNLMKESGLISEEEFNNMKAQLLSQIM